MSLLVVAMIGSRVAWSNCRVKARPIPCEAGATRIHGGDGIASDKMAPYATLGVLGKGGPALVDLESGEGP